MTDEIQSQIYQTITSNGQYVWINLAHVVSVVNVTPIHEPIRIIRVALSNNDIFEISRCPYRHNDPNGTDLTQGFIYALTSFHNQNQ